MRACAVAILLLSMESMALANGGPFLVREPGGDPATKGAPAPILPDLLPGRESRLQVVKEELGFRFTGHSSPRIEVQAQYSIRNPTDDEITLEIGFPIVRGIFRPYYSGGMGEGSFGLPMVTVRVEKKSQPFEIVSNSDLLAPDRLNRYAATHPYKIVSNSDLLTRIRRHAYGTIDGALVASPGLKALRDQLKAAAGNNKSAEDAQKKLAAVLIKEKGWSERDAGLLANFARVIWQPAPPPPPAPSTAKAKEVAPDWLQRNYPEEAGGRRRRYEGPPQEVPFFEERETGTIGLGFFRGSGSRSLPYLGPLASLGELKATQLFSHLASRFDPTTGRSYESIFTAWGGDVRERAVDLGTGALRPRQNARTAWAEEPIYARVEAFNPDLVVDLEKRAACKAIAANLPVTFTFAPMNLIRTTVTFPKRSTSFLIFTYVQNPFEDSAAPASYQLAYLVHPASFWEQFGPIEVTIQVPKGVPVSASVPTKRTEVRSGIAIYKGVLKDKTGELLVAVPKDAWKRLPDDNK